MRRITLATLAPLLLIGAPAVARAQAPPVPHIAAGVTAAGTDVSGLTLPDAAAKVRSAFAAQLAKPLTLKVAGQRFTLDPARIKLVLDGDRTASRAFQAGYRPHTGVLDVRLYVTYDK